MLYRKQSRSNQELQRFPQKCEMEKYSQPGSEYWSYSISGCVHKLREQNSCHLSGAKPVAPVVSVGEPALLRDTLTSDVVYGCTSAICSPATCSPCQPGWVVLPAGWWLAPAHRPAPTQYGHQGERPFNWSCVH